MHTARGYFNFVTKPFKLEISPAYFTKQSLGKLVNNWKDKYKTEKVMLIKSWEDCDALYIGQTGGNCSSHIDMKPGKFNLKALPPSLKIGKNIIIVKANQLIDQKGYYFLIRITLKTLVKKLHMLK